MIFFGVILGIAVLAYFLDSATGAVNIVTGYFVNLSAAQIAQYASNAGFEGDDLVTAVAIALAESSGNPGAVGDNGTSIGLWQIHYTVHPEFDSNQLTDPQYNANSAYSLYSRRGNSFNDWSTYTVEVNGVFPYTKYLDMAQAGVNG